MGQTPVVIKKTITLSVGVTGSGRELTVWHRTCSATPGRLTPRWGFGAVGAAALGVGRLLTPS